MTDKQRKILIATFTIPYPADDGGKLYVFGTVDYLRQYYEIVLLLCAWTETDLKDIARLRTMWKNVQIEVVNYYVPPVPVPDYKPSYFRKTVNIIRAAKNYILNHEQTPEAVNIAVASKPVLPPSDFTTMHPAYISKFTTVIASHQFDIVQVEYTQYLSLVHLLPANAARIFVEIESRSLLVKDFISVNPDSDAYTDYYLANIIHLERNYMSCYDVILALSEEDGKRLSDLLPSRQVFVSPYGIPEQYIRPEHDMLAFNPEKLIFIGSESHYPNKDAIEWFIGKILTGMPDRKLYITGRWSEAFQAQFAHNEQIVFTGFVDDINSLMANSIMIVPIRLGGGGLRAKIIQALAFGIPVVSTDLGCAGSGTRHGESVMIANTETDFIHAIHSLATDRSLCLHLIENGSRLVRERYTTSAAGLIRRNLYENIIEEFIRSRPDHLS